MKIPEGDAARFAFYREVAQTCFASRDRRRMQYELLKYYFMYGCAPEEGIATYNKILPTIDTLVAFIFSADSTRFACQIGRDENKTEWAKVPIVGEEINRAWHDCNADHEFEQSLIWALVYNSTILKLVPKGGMVNPYMVEPHMFGVYREDSNYLDRQEALAMKYYITRSQLEMELEKHPRKDEILRQLTAKPRQDTDEMPEALRRIIVTNAFGTGPLTPGNTVRGGNANYSLDALIQYAPHTLADVIEMTELWVWNDDEKDYQTVTQAEEYVTIYDRKNIFMEHEHPFVQVCPIPLKGYFWGMSEVGRLVPLQQMRNRRMLQIEDLLEKQVRPPTEMRNYSGLLDELDFALNKAGGVLATDNMAEAHPHRPEVPNDVFAEVKYIDEMFAEASGLQNLLMGRGEVGVRSGRQTSELARLGSARIKKRALTIEDSLDHFATKFFKAKQHFVETKYKTKDGMAFSLSQMPPDTRIKVDAHSNSPLFMEDHKSDAMFMLENHVIDRESYIELTNPPMKDGLIHRLHDVIEPQEAAAAAKAQAEEAAKSGPK